MRNPGLTLSLAALLSLGVLAQAPKKPLSDASLGAWLKFIKPTEAELSYESIGWRNSFWPAVQEAKKLGRPILLWTMNGHPLGCT